MNYLALIYLSLHTIKLVSTKSFTLVIDTTTSMQDEIDVIRRNVQSLENVFKNETVFEDFIVVPFNDPGK